jgi:cytochrome oxidase Cu insertion factor (SCO1/SenC/PrrC family)
MTGRGLALLSLLLSVGAVAGYFSLLRVVAIRNHPALYLAAFALATAIAAGATWRAWRPMNLAALAVSVALLALGSWFNFVYAKLPPPTTTLRVGGPAPDFTLPDAAGRPVTLSSYRGQKAVVVVFYRGSW